MSLRALVLLVSFVFASPWASAVGPSTCADAWVGVQLSGVSSAAHPAIQDTRQILDRYFEYRHSANDSSITGHESPLYGRSWNPLAGARVRGWFFADAFSSEVCHHGAGATAIESARQRLEAELREVSRRHSGLLNTVSVTLRLLSLEEIFVRTACDERFYSYRLGFHRPNRLESAAELRCFRPGSRVGSEGYDTQNGLEFSMLNPFASRTAWCRGASDMEAERQRMLAECPEVQSAALERRSLSAMLLVEYLGL